MMSYTNSEYDRGYSLAKVRNLFGLDSVFEAPAHAKRPPCTWCGERVTGTSFVENAVEGCIHAKCRKERARFYAVFAGH